MVDACVTNGIYPFYGPFGDIKDMVACEDQFRNAYLLGCVGAWKLHPVQIAIAKKVFSPEPADVGPRPAGDRGHGRRHGRDHARRQDGGRRVGQAVPGGGRTRRALSERRSRARRRPRRLEETGDDNASVPAARCCTCRRPTNVRSRRPDDPGRRDHLRPRGRRRARRQGRRARDAVRGGAVRVYGSRELTIRINGLDTQWARRTCCRRRRGSARDRGAEGRFGRVCRASCAADDRRGARRDRRSGR